jgi:hypothetical protein
MSYSKEEAIEEMNDLFSWVSKKVNDSSFVVDLVDRVIVVSLNGKPVKCFSCSGSRNLRRSVRRIEAWNPFSEEDEPDLSAMIDEDDAPEPEACGDAAARAAESLM